MRGNKPSSLHGLEPSVLHEPVAIGSRTHVGTLGPLVTVAGLFPSRYLGGTLGNSSATAVYLEDSFHDIGKA